MKFKPSLIISNHLSKKNYFTYLITDSWGSKIKLESSQQPWQAFLWTGVTGSRPRARFPSSSFKSTSIIFPLMFNSQDHQDVNTEKLPFQLTFFSQEYLQNPEVSDRNIIPDSSLQIWFIIYSVLSWLSLNNLIIINIISLIQDLKLLHQSQNWLSWQSIVNNKRQ